MRVTSIPAFRRRVPRRTQMTVLRNPLARTARPSRHLLWTRALVERLLRRILTQAMCCESMTLLRTARRWISGPRRLLLRDSPGLFAPISTPERTVLQLRESTRWLCGKRRVSSSRSTRNENAARRASPSQSRWSSARRQPAVFSTIARGKRAEIPAMSQVCAREEHSHEFPPHLVVVGRIPRLLRNETAALSAAESIPRRVPNQYRRVEDRSFARSVNSSENGTPKLPSGASVVADRPRARLPHDAAASIGSPTGRREPVVQPQLETNVAEITDAVLKQLDRRLVAARERMGRI